MSPNLLGLCVVAMMLLMVPAGLLQLRAKQRKRRVKQARFDRETGLLERLMTRMARGERIPDPEWQEQLGKLETPFFREQLEEFRLRVGPSGGKPARRRDKSD